VNPRANATVEGTTRISFPFASRAPFRFQMICSMQGNPGRISQVAFRRDNDTAVASMDYTAFSVDLDLTVSSSPRTAATMSRQFAANVGADARVVHTGLVNWPAQQKMPPGPTAFAYAIPMPAPFLFLGSTDITLDLALKNNLNTNTSFFLDANSSALGSGFSSVKLGDGCPLPANNLVLAYNNWFPGAQARILLYEAASNVPSVMLFGNNTTNFNGIPLPFDLAPLGAPGCMLYTNIIAMITGMTSTAALYKGRLEHWLEIPADPTLSGVPLSVQFMNFLDTNAGNPANISVSQGFRITIGTLVPGMPPQSEAHDSSLTSVTAILLQQGYGPIVEFTY
jgi:hypothetical protein